jgi:hypothetical protein
MDFYALKARTPKSSIVGENEVTALFANHLPIGKDGHRMELVIDYAIWTTNFFLRHFRRHSLAQAVGRDARFSGRASESIEVFHAI